MKFLKIKTTDRYDANPEVIDINSLEELLKLSKLSDDGIIIRENSHDYPEKQIEFVLEIYDGYRE